MISKRLCVVIVNYKTSQYTLDCIDSLKDQLDIKKDHIVIVDNNSGGSDSEIIDKKIKEDNLSDLFTLINAPQNNGFSYGNNIGIKAIDAQYYLLTNSDTLFRPEAISNLFIAVDKYPEAGLISPNLEWLNGISQTSCFNFHTPLTELMDSARTGFISSLFQKYDVSIEPRTNESKPEWTSFACVLVKKNVFEKIGYLDEKYFMYYEDIDFCRRANIASIDILNWPYSSVVHLQGKSSGIKDLEDSRKRLPSYYYESRTRYFTKYYGGIGFFFSNICWYIGRFISLLQEIFRRRKPSLPKKQHIDIWKRKKYVH